MGVLLLCKIKSQKKEEVFKIMMVERIQTGRETKISISERTYTKYDVPEFMRREDKNT